LGGFFIERIMASSNFQKCLAFVLKYEGGKSDDPRDPGGKTMEGITQRTYDAFLDKKGKPRRDVFEIPSSDRDEIYRTEFWDAIRADSLRPGEDLCIFDLAVNSGPHRALQIWNEESETFDTVRRLAHHLKSDVAAHRKATQGKTVGRRCQDCLRNRAYRVVLRVIRNTDLDVSAQVGNLRSEKIRGATEPRHKHKMCRTCCHYVAISSIARADAWFTRRHISVLSMNYLVAAVTWHGR
jgi:lysozyme family protein